MRIAIDASRTTISRRTGTENYALQMIRHLLNLDTPHEFHLYFRDMPSPGLFPQRENIVQHIIPFPRIWTHIRFAAALWQKMFLLNKMDVTWVPAHTLPRFFPGRAVVTIHDLGYRHFPDAHPEKERRYLDWTTRFSAHRATLVMADSLATKNDLEHFYQIPAHKIRVVYPGIDETLSPVSDSDKLAQVRAKYNLPEKYLFFLGTLQPRKNIARLVQAFAQWHTASGNENVMLVLGGKPGWLYDERWTKGIPNVQILGYVDDADVPALYSGAMALLFPSLYEGFGFPVLEAMRFEIPVLCSYTSSLPELAGDAALFVNPLDTDDIAAGIGKLVNDENLRREMVERGKAQVQKFTWQAAAQNALAVLEEAADS